MATILQLGRRIQTAQNVSKTTRAMQMIATSKLKRAQDAALSSRAYVEKLTSITKNVTSNLDKNEIISSYMQENDSQKSLIIILSPDKGLCGGLITNLVKELLSQSLSSKNTTYINIGKKLEAPVARLDKEVIASFEFGTTLPSFDIVYPIVKLIDEEFISKKVSEVKIIYSKFQNVFTQIPQTVKILPVTIDEADVNTANSSFSIFEPRAEEMLPSILKHYIEMTIYQLILESYASEQAARMISMKNATENALDMIDDLKLEYNKQRQEKITNEILDIGSGASFLTHE